MKTTIRPRGADGRFVPLTQNAGRIDWVLFAQMMVAGVVALGMALLCARCHMVWSGNDVVMPLQMSRDLLPPLA